MSPDAANLLAPALAAVGPWAHYGYPADVMATNLQVVGDGAIRYQLNCGDVPSGAVVIRSPWLAGPYLQMLAIVPALQGCGAGAAVLRWYEGAARAAGLRQAWLCVSGFNTEAQRFYLRHGYARAAVLPDLMRDGDDEFLMRKLLARRDTGAANEPSQPN